MSRDNRYPVPTQDEHPRSGYFPDKWIGDPTWPDWPDEIELTLPLLPDEWLGHAFGYWCTQFASVVAYNSLGTDYWTPEESSEVFVVRPVPGVWYAGICRHLSVTLKRL